MGSGLRARTRKLFARDFRKHGQLMPSTHLKVYKVGDLVDVKVNGSIQKGMPHKFYHGKTGVVFNVSRRGIGVIVNKRVGNRIMEKKILVRTEHVKHSRSRLDFLMRVKANAEKIKAAKTDKVRFDLKRSPKGPMMGHTVSIKNAPINVAPVEYKLLV